MVGLGIIDRPATAFVVIVKLAAVYAASKIKFMRVARDNIRRNGNGF